MSEFWQWFSFIISVVAFLMAAPTFLQLLFAQPKIGLVFNYDDTGKEGRLLKVHLTNYPINNRILQLLKVSRISAQDVFLTITVSNALTRQIIEHDFIPDIALSMSNKGGRVSLPPSLLASSVSLVRWQKVTNSAVLLKGNSSIPLQEGIYIVSIRLEVDGREIRYKPFYLHIGKTENEMVWDKNITDKILLP